MGDLKPSILDRVKAALQSVLTRFHSVDHPEEPPTSDRPPETPLPDVAPPDSPSSVPWLTTTHREILEQMQRGTTTERR